MHNKEPRRFGGAFLLELEWAVSILHGFPRRKFVEIAQFPFQKSQKLDERYRREWCAIRVGRDL